MSPDSSVAEFRNEVHRRLSIHTDDSVWFKFPGHHWGDNQTLSECKVVHEATVRVFGDPLSFRAVNSDLIATAYAATVRWLNLTCFSSTDDLVTRRVPSGGALSRAST